LRCKHPFPLPSSPKKGLGLEPLLWHVELDQEAFGLGFWFLVFGFWLLEAGLLSRSLTQKTKQKRGPIY
jgi:hypothetical protein